MTTKISEAKQILKDAGYFTDNLWHVNDVKERFNCTDEQAQEILNDALTNEGTMERIHDSIRFFANEQELEETREI